MDLLVYLIVSLLMQQSTGYNCTSDMDCELLGACVNSECICKPGWTGDSCSTLNLGTAPNPNYGIYPSKYSHDTQVTYSWGFSIIYDKSDSKYHGFVNTGCFNCTSMVDGTFILHVTSDNKTGPFTAHEITMPQSSFNPHVIYDSNKQLYLLYFRINGLTSLAQCIGNATNTTSKKSIPNGEIINNQKNGEISGNFYNFEKSDKLNTTNNLTANSMDIGVSDSPYGPWTVSTISAENNYNLKSIHQSNPSGLVLKNGSYVMAYRYNLGNEYVGISISYDNYVGPYINIANLSVAGEDPFIWQDANDDTFHIIFHVENGQAYSNWPSLHAYSRDLRHWNVSTSYTRTKMGAYSTNVTWDNGQETEFYRRERPELMFDENGHPQYFYTAVQEFRLPANSTHYGYSYSVVQAVNN